MAEPPRKLDDDLADIAYGLVAVPHHRVFTTVCGLTVGCAVAGVITGDRVVLTVGLALGVAAGYLHLFRPRKPRKKGGSS